MHAIIRKYTNTKLFDISLILLPILFLCVFVGIPFVYSILMSFQDVDPVEMANIIKPWNGLNNFIDIIEDDDFWLITTNTIIFLLLSIFGQFVIGFILALIFENKFFGSGILRGLILIPWILPAIVIGVVWNWIFAGDAGVLNYILQVLHLQTNPVYWLSDPKYSLYSVIIANIWLGIPFNMIMLSVSLADIPKDIYEVAAIEGVGVFRKFFSITLPLMKMPIVTILSLGVILTLQQFDLFMALTEGGPSDSSNVLQLWSWKLSFTELEFGLGAATAVLTLLIMLVAAIFYVLASRQKD